MKYALTFSGDGSFTSTDTVLFSLPEPFDESEEKKVVYEVLDTYLPEAGYIDYIVNNRMYFIRNCDDEDVIIEGFDED